MKYLKVSEAAKQLEVTEQRIRRGMAAKRYPHLKIGSHSMVDVDALADIIAKEGHKGLSIKEICAETGLRQTAMRQAMKEGWIPYWKLGKAFQFDLDAVQLALMEQQEKQMEG